MIDLTSSELFSSTAIAASLQSAPLGFIDVGARGGAHPFVAPIAGYTSVLGFEPDQDHCAELMAEQEQTGRFAAFHLEPVALGKADETATLYLQNVATNHSLLDPNRGFVARYDMVKWRNEGRMSLKTGTLDDVLFGALADKPFMGEFIKLDTQGSEYDILLGADRTLRERCVAMISEVSFTGLYDGMTVFSDLERHLRGYGFSFYGFGTTYTRSCRQLDKQKFNSSERLIQADAFFFKDPLPGGTGPVLCLDTRQMHMLSLCALLCGFNDYALELAKRGWADRSEIARMTGLTEAVAAQSNEQAVQDVADLHAAVQADPDRALALAGRFVDQRRDRNNFADWWAQERMEETPLTRGI